jgi:tetraacyldisaccharide 4'-kinase
MIFLYPFALLYSLITFIRNKLYQCNILQSYQSHIPTIIIGNLSTGGTGKSPHASFIIDQLRSKYATVLLSRGYKRKTKGFIIAGIQSNASQIGDEPMEYLTKFKNIHVTVGEKRVDAVQKIEQLLPETQCIVLDDAFQHRAIKGDLNILLTTYQKPFFEDFVLPAGSLREPRCGYKRAHYIIVTKCPNTISDEEINAIIHNIKPSARQKVLFSTYKYCTPIDFFHLKEVNLKNSNVCLVTGIANNNLLIEHLKDSTQNLIVKTFNDHKDYKWTDIQKIIEKLPPQYTIVLTRKDAVKWWEYKHQLQHIDIAIQDIEVSFLTEEGGLLKEINQIIQTKNEFNEFL